MAQPRVGSHENGYIRFDMDPRFASEFKDFRARYVEGGPGAYEYAIPVRLVPRFNELTRSRSWIEYE